MLLVNLQSYDILPSFSFRVNNFLADFRLRILGSSQAKNLRAFCEFVFAQKLSALVNITN